MVHNEKSFAKAREIAKIIWSSRHIDSVHDQTDTPCSEVEGSEDSGEGEQEIGKDAIAGTSAPVGRMKKSLFPVEGQEG